MAGVFSLIFMLVGLGLKLLMKLRLMPLLLYVVLMCTVFVEWQHSHEGLAIGVFAAIAVATKISWVATLVRFVRERLA